jgi:hypothetical protein
MSRTWIGALLLCIVLACLVGFIRSDRQPATRTEETHAIHWTRKATDFDFNPERLTTLAKRQAGVELVAPPGEVAAGGAEAKDALPQNTALAGARVMDKVIAVAASGRDGSSGGGRAGGGTDVDRLRSVGPEDARTPVLPPVRFADPAPNERADPANLPAKQTNSIAPLPPALATVVKGDSRIRDTAEVPQGKKTPTDEKPPQVWQRDATRPTFARVYVGDGNSLELVSIQVTVVVEGPRARTLVDHVFRNPHDKQLEGTFEYPLPTGASPSYFAMFLGQSGQLIPPRFAARDQQPPPTLDDLGRMQPAQVVQQVSVKDWGKLQQARVVNNAKGLETYENIVRRKIDPALLQYAGGNTFSGRVFPIPPKGFNRVLIAYEETLPVSADRQVYRFPLPDRKLSDMTFSLQLSEREGANASIEPKDARSETKAGRRVFTRSWKDETPTGEVVFSSAAQSRIQVVSGRENPGGPVHVFARLRPDLVAQKTAPHANHAVFLLDTSLSEHPARFGVSVQLLTKILESDPDIRHFNVLTFDQRPAWVSPQGWLENTTAGRQNLLDKLDGILLEGATDLGAALDRLANPGFAIAPGTPVNCFLLSDGNLTWGQTEVAPLLARFERSCPFDCRFHCYRTGQGAENLELFEALTRTGGGIFQAFTEADIPAAALAHRHECLRVERVSFQDGPAASDVLIAGRKGAIYPDGELIVAAKLATPGKSRIVVEGTFQGQPFSQEFVLDAEGSGELAVRGWAEVAVASLQALNDPKLEAVITAYCQRYGIGSRSASFLVLEDEADFKRLNLEEERGRTLPGDLGVQLNELWANLARDVSPRQLLTNFLDRIESRVNVRQGANGEHVRKLLELLSDSDFAIPTISREATLRYSRDVPAAYRDGVTADRRDVHPYLTEARRRADVGDVAGAVRVLSSIIEELPARGDALRLVGYRLLDLDQPAEAVGLFQRVQQQRPFEPHSYRDLARSLEECGRLGLAALQYEIVLAGTWDARFRNDIKVVAQEEYARMMQQAIRSGKVSGTLANHFGERLEKMQEPSPRSDLRVSITWNTDGTDVDLWVQEPNNEVCCYQRTKTSNGGELSGDQTQGYGPERYRIEKATPGEYVVLVHYFAANQNLLGGETHVQVAVTRFAGTPQEVTERKTVILTREKEGIEVCRIRY